MLLEDENILDVEMSDNGQEDRRKSELESIFKNVDDLSDPSCMDNILIHLQEIRDQDYLFMEVNMQAFIKRVQNALMYFVIL